MIKINKILLDFEPRDKVVSKLQGISLPPPHILR